MSRVLRINQYTLQDYRQHYMVLNSMNFDQQQNKLVFENNILPVSEMVIDEIFLMMDLSDLRLFINDGFYIKSEDNFIIEKLCERLFLVEQDYEFLNEYVRKVNDRLKIYMKYRNVLESNIDSLSIKIFLQDTLIAKKIIDRSIALSNPANQNVDTILASIYEKNKIDYSNQDSTKEEMNNDKDLTLKRTNNNINYNDGFGSIFDEESYIQNANRLNTAGFISYIAVLAVAILFGIYIAVISIG